MKKNSFLLLVLLSVFTLGWTSCTDSVDYSPAEAVKGQGVYFPKSVETSYTLKDVKGEISLDVYRTVTTGSFEAPLTATFSEGGESLFTVPANASFTEGNDSTGIVISFDNLVRGTNYEVSLAFADATVYGNSAIKLNVIYPAEKTYEWKVVSEDAVFIDNLFSMFGASDISFVKDLGRKIVVEKADGLNLFRFQSPYDNEYFTALFGISDLFPADYKFPYIVLDGETYKEHNLWFIKAMNLGFQMVNGQGPKFDTEWNTFGSVAGNLKTAAGPIPPTSQDFPLGTFDKKSKSFDFGVTYHNLGNHGYVVNDATFKLFLDPKLMEPDFDRDYTWNDVENSQGQFTSELSNGQIVYIPVQQSEEDPTFYRFHNLYSETGSLYFNIKDGVVTLPKGQKTGLTTYGNKIYMEGTPGKSSFDEETKLLSLGVTFYLVDKDGKKSVELISGIESFMWGHTEVDQLILGKSIDDYVGSWDVLAIDVEKGPIKKIPVSLTKSSPNELLIQGLSFAGGYDDKCLVEYNPATGLLAFRSQRTANHPVGLPVFASLFDSSFQNDPDFAIGTEDILIGGFMNDNTIQFFNDPSNDVRWDGISYFAVQDQQIMFLVGAFADLEWTKTAIEKTANLLNISMSKFVAAENTDEFKVTLNTNRVEPDKEQVSLKCTVNADCQLSE